MFEMTTAAGLWIAVIASGLYHGLNPGMGWPLAVSAGLMGKGRPDLFRALGPLTVGHLAAMLVVLAPFALLAGLIAWEREIRIGAALLVIAAGVYLTINRRHPRVLARIAPHKLALWSFAVATAHGAGLMLLPVYLGICGLEGDHGAAVGEMMAAGVGAALLVAGAHAAAMVAGGGLMAVLIHDLLGLAFLRKTWFNLDLVWALSLILVGVVALWLALT